MYFYKRITDWHVFVIVLALFLASCSAPVGEVIVVDVSGREEAVQDLLDRIVHAAKAQPDSAEARGRLAMAYEVNGYIPAAIASYQQANAIDQNQFNWWYFKAILLARSGETSEAREAIQQALNIDDQYVSAWLWSAQWALETGQYKDAERAYEHANDLGGEEVASAVGLANIYLATNRPNDALLALSRITSGDNIPFVQRLFGRIYNVLGRESEASKSFDRGNSDIAYRWLDPIQNRKVEFTVSYGGRLNLVEQYLERGRLDRAIELVTGLSEEGYQSSFQFRLAGRAYLLDKRYSTSGRILREGISRYPQDFELRIALAQFYQAVQDIPNAIVQLRVAKKLMPQRGQTHLLLATLLAEQGKLDAALFELDQGLRLGINRPSEAFYTGGMIEVSRSAWSAANERFEKAVELDPSMTMGFVSLALSLAEMGRFDEAIEKLRIARQIGTHLREIENARSNIRELESSDS